MNKELANSVNVYLSNAGVMFIKLHNVHWNVIGKEFKSVHEYLQVIYEEFSLILDDVAEILKMEGVYPRASLKDYLEVATIKEIESKDYSVEEVLKITVDDLTAMQTLANEIREFADKEGHFELTDLMQAQLTSYKKHIWFIKSMLK
ncbi:MAG: Dps family protein [Lachnospirales bacterium]